MKKILVVDDNELLCRLACDILHTEGYHASAATSAAEALEALENDQFDLVVTNFAMPGMSGLDLQKELASRKIKIPVIVVSAHDDASIRGLAHEFGAVAFFKKPVDDQALIDAIHWATEASRRKSGPILNSK